MENPHTSAPLTLHLYCRVDVLVTDAEALADRAVAQLRDADVDWSTEDDDLESAARTSGVAAAGPVASAPSWWRATGTPTRVSTREVTRASSALGDIGGGFIDGLSLVADSPAR